MVSPAQLREVLPRDPRRLRPGAPPATLTVTTLASLDGGQGEHTATEQQPQAGRAPGMTELMGGGRGPGPLRWPGFVWCGYIYRGCRRAESGNYPDAWGDYPES